MQAYLQRGPCDGLGQRIKPECGDKSQGLGMMGAALEHGRDDSRDGGKVASNVTSRKAGRVSSAGGVSSGASAVVAGGAE